MSDRDSTAEVHWYPPRRGLWLPAWWFARTVLGLTLPWLYDLRISGRHHLPARGGVLVVANHIGDADGVFLGFACVPRPAQYVVMARHFTGRLQARLLFGLGLFPIRAGADMRALRYAREQLAAGRLVMIFPEGTPNWGGPLGKFREGVGLIGLSPGTTVVPAAIWGTQRVLRNSRPAGRGPVRVAFGPPLEIPAEGDRRERAHQLTERARAAVDELLTSLRSA